MFILKLPFKVLVLPLVALSTFTVAGYAIGEKDFNWWAAIITAIVTSIAYSKWDAKQDKIRFTKHVSSLGVNPEYLACFGDNGIAIDRTNQKLFAGTLNKGKVFNFRDIYSIEKESKVDFINNHDKYFIHINTKDIEFPKVTISFTGDKIIREQAFGKLIAALKFV